MRYVHARTGADAAPRADFAERRPDRWLPASDTPSTSDVKAVWVNHAIAQGADRDEAESMTKADLVDTYGA